MVWTALIQAGAAVSKDAVKENTKRETAAFNAVFDPDGGGNGMVNKPDFRTTEAVFDNSGWNVSFGNSRITSDAEKSTSLRGADGSGSGLSAGGFGGLLSSVSPEFLLLAAGGILAIVIVLKKRKGA